MVSTQLVAVLIAEGSKILGQLWRNRPIKIETQQITSEAVQSTSLTIEPSKHSSEKASEIATGCVPCATGHLSTCSGLLNEAMRFARSDGIQFSEVIDRVGMCLEELNVMERVDLRPELITNLPPWEKELANQVLDASRIIRHSLEGLNSVETLEKAAAGTQSLKTQIWRDYIKARMEHLTPEEQAKIQKKVIDKMSELSNIG